MALKEFPTSVGGVLCRIFKGNVIPSEVVAQWPVNNRRAMEQTKFVRYFLTPAEAAEAAAQAA